MWRQRFDRSAHRDDAQFRRGSVLGLTFGEVFLLLSFVLLLLLGLLEVQRRADRTDLAGLRPFGPAVEAATERNVPPKTLQHLIEGLAPEDLRDPEMVADYSRTITTARSQGIEPDRFEQLLSAVADRPPEDIDFVRSDLEAGEFIRKKAQGVVPGELADWLILEPEKRDLALEIARGADERAIDRIREVLGRDIALRDDVTGAVQRALGDLVSEKGGSIDSASGSISLPDNVLFEPGSAELTPETRSFLEEFCGPWINAIHGFSDRIAELRIEGHASSEWFGATTPGTAYLNNLDLSQRRSAEVVQFCLSRPMSPDIAGWARKKLVAVGHSSSRPVLLNGEEDRVRSRRVVFGFETDKQQVLEDIKRNIAGQPAPAALAEAPASEPSAQVEPEPELPPIKPRYEGPARVVEAGVISVESAELRLSNVEAPGIEATCRDAQGPLRPCGRIAAMRLAEWLDGSDVICEPAGQGRDATGRPLAHCRRGGTDVGDWLIKAGHAKVAETSEN
ncbi:MAG: OmpA family protein [Ruegeria sp.]